MSLFDQFSWDGTRAFPYWWSAYWLGPTAIPPLTMPIALTDRANAKLIWYMQVTDDGKHIRFTTAAPAGPARIYGPYDGPFVGSSGLRMGISNGHVVVEQLGQSDCGPGPFCRGVTSGLNAAVIWPVPSLGGGQNYYDHLAFQSAPVQNSIFDPTP